MQIRTENVWATVTGTEEELDWLDEYLTVTNPKGAFFGGKYRPSNHRFLTRDGRYLAGLTPQVVRAARSEGFAVTVTANRVSPAQWDPNTDTEWLRDYQRTAVDVAVKRTRGILKMPTGAGKTEVVIALVKGIACKWLFLVHRADLLNQTAKRYETRTGMVAGRIGDGKWDVEDFTVATFQTLSKHMKSGRSQKFLETVDAVVVDECHVLPADTFLKVVQSMTNAYWRFGVSGTPLARGDRKSIGAIGALGPLIHRVETPDLIAQGFLSRPTIRMVPCEQHYPAGNMRIWRNVYKGLVVNSVKRNGTLVDMIEACAKPALVFVTQTKHGYALMRFLQHRGIATDIAEGRHSTLLREGKLEALQRSDIDALVCTSVFREGIDIPSLRSVVIAGAGASAIAALQSIGRGTRTTEDKSTFEVWDVWDEGDKSLNKQAKKRAKAYQKEGHAVHVGSLGGPSRILASQIRLKV